MERIPTLSPDGLRGGTVYYDGQFDDARLAIALARTLATLDGCLVNYMAVTALLKTEGCIRAVAARDEESGRSYEIPCRVAINAAGIFADDVRLLDNPAETPMLKPSQGVHIVLDKKFLPGDAAIMVPHTDDGRVLFAVPWLGRVIVGTTDTPVNRPDIEPMPRTDEIDFLISHAARYLTGRPDIEDIRSVFAGIRPLVEGREGSTTAALSRDHQIVVSPSGLVTVVGGKWTTYRKMGEDAVSIAARVAGLEERASETRRLRLQGAASRPEPDNPFARYGSDADMIRQLIAADSGLEERLHPALAYRKVDVIWSVRYEMARTLTDVLSRRLRALILDTRAAVEMAARTAAVMAEELGKDRRWQSYQVAEFRKLARGYLPRAISRRPEPTEEKT